MTVFPTGFGTGIVHRLRTVVAVRPATGQRPVRQVVAESRPRLSRDPRDLLGHTLSVMVVKAVAVGRLAAVEPDDAVRRTADIEDIGWEALVAVRQAVTGTSVRPANSPGP